MSRVENNSKKRKYLYIIVGLVAIIAGLFIFIVVHGYSNKSKEEVNRSEVSTSPYESTDKSSSMSHSSTEVSMSNSASNSEYNYASEAVKKLSVEQRAALIVLGAPEDWLFNGYPSQSTMNKSVRQIAESDTNIIKLTKANRKLASNTSEEDQIFYVTGKDVQGVGGIPKLTYAFGRENNKIYYYVAKTGVGSKPDTEIATSLGEANIDDIWKAYFDVGDMATVNKIANNIIIE
jgi:hypothetical protein